MRPAPTSSAGGEPASIPGAEVPHNLFTLFGVEPILGRTFLPEEEREGNDRVVILSESLWRSRFNADRSLIGKSILIDGQNHQVVGIVPASFRLPLPRHDERAVRDLPSSGAQPGGALAADGQFQLRRCRPRQSAA